MQKVPTFGIVCITNQDLRQTKEFINYHLSIGARHMVVCLDDPNDPAISSYAGNPRVTCVACTEEHWERVLGRQPLIMHDKVFSNFRFGFELMRGWGIDHLHRLRRVALLHFAHHRRPPLYVVPPVEAIHHRNMHEDRVFRSRYFKRVAANPRANRQMLRLSALGEESALLRQGFFGHTQGKTFVRSSADIVDYIQHLPTLRNPGTKIKSKDVMLLHFDCLSLKNWKEKWWRRIFGSTRAVTISTARKSQENVLREAMSSGNEAGLKRLFLRWHWWPDGRIAKSLQMDLLEEVDIPAEKFKSSADETVSP